MKKIITYTCEICGKSFSDKKHALRCELKGRPDISIYPKGLIYGYEKGSIYEHLIFALNGVRVDGHLASGSCWITRDNGIADNLIEQFCGTGFLNLSNGSIPDKNMPAFGRMLKLLKDNNIPVFIWDGEKPIAEDEWNIQSNR